MLFRALFINLTFTLAAGAESAPAVFDLAGEPRQTALQNGLREISGLAIASDNSVYAHNDEHGIVYEVSLADGKAVKAFALGDPTTAADFEGVAIDDGRVYLITSHGRLYEAPLGAHRARVKFNVYDTGAGDFCEVEGLTKADAPGAFLILCKTPRPGELENTLAVFRWSLVDRAAVVAPWLALSYADFLQTDDIRVFRPSAIEWRRDDNTLVILSARSLQLAVVDLADRSVEVRDLSPQFHVQPEGVTLTPDGALVIADEGAGRGPGRLSVYPPQR
ncbi:MAG: hypothetical protein ACX939_02145 [Hyphococcus sp.]